MCVQISELCTTEVEASRHDDLGDQGQVVECLKRNLLARQQQTRNLNPKCIHVSLPFSVLSAQFLPCDAMHCTVLVIAILSVCLSVCPSVCLSVTLVDCVHMVRPTIMISSPYGSPITLGSGDITFIPKFEGGHPKRGH